MAKGPTFPTKFSEGSGTLIQVDLSQVASDIEDIAEEVINSTLQMAYAEAERLVPVRKVFKGSKQITNTRRARFLTRNEAKAEQAVRRQLGLASTLREIQQVQTLKEPTRQTRVSSNPFLRVPRKINQPEGDRTLHRSKMTGGFVLASGGRTLNSRGRWELRHAHIPGPRSAAYEFVNPRTHRRQTTLGGRLKGEIRVEPAEFEGKQLIGRLVSPTYYARYVEFGTRHAAAQPYMRPALAKVRENFARQMQQAIRERGRMPRKHVRTGGPAFGRR